MDAMDASDRQLWRACPKLPSDFAPHGRRRWAGRREHRPDCATCCWFLELFRSNWPDWGVCANPKSPRAGLLTNWNQGCSRFEQETGERHTQTLAQRSDFKNCFERALREHAAEYIRAEVQRANDSWADEPPPAEPVDIRKAPIFITLRRLLRQGDVDLGRPALNSMAAAVRKNTRRYWQYARRYWAKIVGADVASIRLPANRLELEGEFWQRVDAAISEALVGRGSKAPQKRRTRASARNRC